MFQNLHQHIIDGETAQATNVVQHALASGMDPAVILNEGLIAPMTEVGSRFERGDFFVPEMLVAAHAMEAGLAILRPHLLEAGVQPLATAVIGTVRGDLHDIGKNLVGMMLEGAGFKVIDLGANVSPQQFVDAVRKFRPEIIAMSALLTTTMQAMADVIQVLSETGLGGHVKIMIGGAPVTLDFAEQIGADGFAPDAAGAARLAVSLIESHAE